MTAHPDEEILARERRLRLQSAREHLELTDRVKAQEAEISRLHDTLRESLTHNHALNEQLEAAQHDEVLVRERHHRLRAAREHLAMSDTIKAQQLELEDVHDSLRESLSEVHAQHQQVAQRDREIQARHADIETFVQRLAAAEDCAAAAEARVAAWQNQSALQRLSGKTPRSARTAPPPLAPFPPIEARYFLHTSPFRLFRDTRFTLRGWAWPEDGRAVTGVRVRIDGEPHIGTWVLPEEEALRVHGDQPNNPLPGFSIEFPTPPGRHLLSLELELGTAGWFTVLQTPIWSESS